MAGGGRLGRPAGCGRRGRGQECVAAFAAAGWVARVAGDWPPEELAARIMGGDTSGQVAAHRAGQQGIDKLARPVKGAMRDSIAGVPSGPVQPRPWVQAARGRLAAVLGTGAPDDYRALMLS